MLRLKPGRDGMIVGIILCVALFTGCATLNKDECLTADWRTIGYEDGAKGLPVSHIAKHRQACSKHGVTPNFDAYEQGRMEGLQEYCTPENGYSLGLAGRQSPSVCPDGVMQAFMDAYHRGRRVYEARKVFNVKQADLGRLYDDLDAVAQKIDDYEAELIDDRTGKKRRKFLLKEIKNLTEEERYLVDETAAQEKVVEDARIHFNTIKHQNPN